MNFFVRCYLSIKNFLLFFVPIQIIIISVNIYLTSMSKKTEYLLNVPLYHLNGLFEIFIFLLHMLSIVIAIYKTVDIELGTFGNYLFTRITKIKFVLRKTLILAIYSIIINSILYYIYYKILIQYNYSLNISYLILNSVITYITYLIIYITTMIFKSTQKSMIFIFITFLTPLCLNINFTDLLLNIVTIPIILLVIISLNYMTYILINKYEKPLKKGID